MRYMLVLFALLLAASCAPSPKDVPCSNQSDCEKVNPQFAYCVQNRCVECLDDIGCGQGVCTSGLCAHKCQDGRQCAPGQICSSGICTEN